jgi:tRNA pseudouridine55 synthase
MDGILIVDKPAGPTSHDVVAAIRRICHQKRVGHTGTLDPAAAGVLVVCLGNATRIIEYLMDWRKRYLATAVFGIETDTEDQTGHTVTEMDCSELTRETVQSALPRLTGKIEQIPPMMSAVHHEGKRLYELARSGQTVERQARTVEVFSLDLTDFEPGQKARAVLDIECSKGTYIRTLCVDLGRAVNCVAHMGSLVRTMVGRFSIDEATSLEDIQRAVDQGKISELLVSADTVLRDMPLVRVSEENAERIRHGVQLPSSSLSDPLPEVETVVRIKSCAGELLAIGRVSRRDDDEVFLSPEKVFAYS